MLLQSGRHMAIKGLNCTSCVDNQT